MKITKKNTRCLKASLKDMRLRRKPNTIAGVDFSEVVNCLHEVKVKPTIYDWSNEPEEVKVYVYGRVRRARTLGVRA